MKNDREGKEDAIIKSDIVNMKPHHPPEQCLENIQKERQQLNRSRLQRIAVLTVGCRVTVKGGSRNRGDARVTLLHTGKARDHVGIEYDDGRKSPAVDSLNVQLFDNEKHSKKLEEQYQM